MDHLNQLDKKGGVNTIAEEPLKFERPSLGKIQSKESNISLANDPGWKILPFNNLPSLGISYPDNSEIAIRSAKVFEIRQWSTIDESDNLSINDQLNFILEKCMSFKIKGHPVLMDWKDLLLIDRFFIIFRIHELTFPNNENTMSKLFTCSNCKEPKFSEIVQVKSSMLQLFNMPEEIMSFYDEKNKAFVVESSKFEPFFIFMPTLGAQSKVRDYVKFKGSSLKDDWFIKVAPYMIDDYRSVNNEWLDKFRMSTLDWNESKFMFVTKAIDLLESAKSNTLSKKCPKCDNLISQNIFTSPNFTIKNLFIVSTKLRDLI